MAQLRAGHIQIQRRIDAVYIGNLNGRIDAAYFKAKAAERLAEQEQVAPTLASHQAANRSYTDGGIQLLDLARRPMCSSPGSRRWRSGRCWIA